MLLVISVEPLALIVPGLESMLYAFCLFPFGADRFRPGEHVRRSGGGAWGGKV